MEVSKLEEVLNEIMFILNQRKEEEKEIKVGISNRHIHLQKEHVEKLFGKEYILEKMKDLSQKGQYACKEVVTLCGPKGCIEKVRVLGPERKNTQVELSIGDCRKLGIETCVRMSGDLVGSAGLTIVGPNGSIQLFEGAIVSQRHIHMNMKDAERFGVHDGEEVAIEILGERGGILHKTIVRIDESFNLECHLDVEEANALGINSKTKVKIIKQ